MGVCLLENVYWKSLLENAKNSIDILASLRLEESSSCDKD